jgi:polyhydroxybutyrate depolymerase
MRWIWIPIALLGCGPDALDAPDAGTMISRPPMDAGSMDAASPDREPIDPGELPNQVTLGGDRPAQLLVPEGYDGAPRPLVVLLHGYSIDAMAQDSYFRLSSRVDELGFFLLLPNGTRPAGGGSRFWNATDACCDFNGSGVDDVGYLRGLIEEAQASFAIEGVHLIGHSNGGFMAYRMACDAAELIDSIVSLAGATFFDESRCQPSEPTRVLQIHGTDDTTIFYEGIPSGEMRYPGAEETVERWASRGGCNLSMMEMEPPIDIERVVPGTETDVDHYQIGCAPPVEVELWRINGGTHVPTLANDFGDRILGWSLGL